MKTIARALVAMFFFASCGRLNEDELFHKAQEAQEQRNFAEAVKNLKELVDRHPDGKRAGEALLMLGGVYNYELQDYRSAVATYRLLCTGYPDAEKTPVALFLIGFIYNNHLQQYDSAKIAYEEFLTKYPDHEMAQSAKFELENLGKSPEELFKTQVAVKEESKQPAKKTRKKK